MGNCIGEKNYKFFCQFVVYSFLTLMVIVIALFRPFCDALFNSGKRMSDEENVTAMALIGFVLAIALALSLGLFIALHSYLLWHGSTTLECHIYGRQFPFDQGWRKNVRDVFGPSKADWFLPTTVRRDSGQPYELHEGELEHLTAPRLFDDDQSSFEDDSLL